MFQNFFERIASTFVETRESELYDAIFEAVYDSISIGEIADMFVDSLEIDMEDIYRMIVKMIMERI